MEAVGPRQSQVKDDQVEGLHRDPGARRQAVVGQVDDETAHRQEVVEIGGQRHLVLDNEDLDAVAGEGRAMEGSRHGAGNRHGPFPVDGPGS